jgi:hypothetical protein
MKLYSLSDSNGDQIGTRTAIVHDLHVPLIIAALLQAVAGSRGENHCKTRPTDHQSSGVPENNATFTKIVYVYGLWLDGHIMYLGSSRQPHKRFGELACGINEPVKSLIVRGAKMAVLQAIPEAGSEPIVGRIIQALKRIGDCGCNDRIPKKARDRDVTWRGRMRWLYGD